MSWIVPVQDALLLIWKDQGMDLRLPVYFCSIIVILYFEKTSCFKVGITTDVGGCFHPFPAAFVEGRRFISDESQRKDLYGRMQLGKYMCTAVCNI